MLGEEQRRRPRVARAEVESTRALQGVSQSAFNQDTVGLTALRDALSGGDDAFSRLVRSETWGGMAGIPVHEVEGSGSLSAMRAVLRRANAEAPDPEAVVPSGGGMALPDQVLRRFTDAFGHDFSHVRIHTGASANQAAEQIGAHAFAQGADLYFGAGEFAPDSPAGERLLAHELTHVVQHDEGRIPSGGGVSDPSDPHEHEAYQNEDRIMSALGSEAEGVEESISAPMAETAEATAAGAGAGAVLSRDADGLVDPWGSDEAAELEDPWADEVAHVAEVLVRATRGEDVSQEDRTEAHLRLMNFDNEGVAIVDDRLRQEGLLDQVVDSGVLGEDERDDMLQSTHTRIEVAITVLHGVSAAEVDRQIEWAQQFYAQQQMAFVVVSRPDPLDEQTSATILGGDSVLNLNTEGEPGDVEPGVEARRALEAAWGQTAANGLTRAVFVPEIAQNGSIEGVNLDEDFFRDMAHGGVLVNAGVAPSVLAHEVGHHLGLDHDEELAHDDAGNEVLSPNLMYENSGRRSELTAEQANTIRRSLLVRLVPGGVESLGAPERDQESNMDWGEALDNHYRENPQ